MNSPDVPVRDGMRRGQPLKRFYAHALLRYRAMLDADGETRFVPRKRRNPHEQPN